MGLTILTKETGKLPKPSSVKVGPQDFAIEFRNPDKDGMLNDGNYGYTLDAGNLIVVANNISLSKQKITLLHEILHAARMVLDNNRPKRKAEFEEWEHYFIGIYENALLTIMRDNPELIDWLRIRANE